MMKRYLVVATLLVSAGMVVAAGRKAPRKAASMARAGDLSSIKARANEAIGAGNREEAEDAIAEFDKKFGKTNKAAYNELMRKFDAAFPTEEEGNGETATEELPAEIRQLIADGKVELAQVSLEEYANRGDKDEEELTALREEVDKAVGPVEGDEGEAKVEAAEGAGVQKAPDLD